MICRRYQIKRNYHTISATCNIVIKPRSAKCNVQNLASFEPLNITKTKKRLIIISLLSCTYVGPFFWGDGWFLQTRIIWENGS